MHAMPRGYARYVLAVMVGINFLNYLDRYILPAVATKIQAEFHLTDGQVGLLGSAFLLVYAFATIPFWHLGRPRCPQDGGRHRGSALLPGGHRAARRLFQEGRSSTRDVDLGGGHGGWHRRWFCRRRDRGQHAGLARRFLHDRGPGPDLRDPGVRAARALAGRRRGARPTSARGPIDHLEDVRRAPADPDAAGHHRGRDRALLCAWRRRLLAPDLFEPALRSRNRKRWDPGGRCPGSWAARGFALRWRDCRPPDQVPTIRQQPAGRDRRLPCRRRFRGPGAADAEPGVIRPDVS